MSTHNAATAYEVRLLGRARDLPRDVHDEAQRLLEMSLAEVGYQREWFWDEQVGAYGHSGEWIPISVLSRARKLALDRLGVPYKLVLIDGSVS